MADLFYLPPNELFTSIFQGGIRYNSYVFIALSQSLFGPEGVFVSYMIITTYTISVLVMNAYGTGNEKTVTGALVALTKNPLIISAIIGVVMNYFGLHLVGAIKQLFSYLSNAATPLSLMSIGAGLIVKMHAERLVAIFYSTEMKLVLMPAFTLLFFFGS